jgi:hypothetical protein
MVRIKVLGLDNNQHKKLRNKLMLALQEYNINAQVEQVTDIEEIINYGVEAIPALLFDNGKIIADKSLPSSEELYKLLLKNNPYSASMDFKSAGE